MKSTFRLPAWPVFVALLLCVGAARSAEAQKITVKSATPASGEQGSIGLDVVITGTGFGPGAQARFVLSGTDKPDGISVRSTRYVSSSQLVATLDIADAASLASFDIKVTLSGRTGKGTDLFQVVQKGNPNVCVLEPLDTTRYQLVGQLNSAPGGQPLYSGAFGVALAATPMVWQNGSGSRAVSLLAVGSNGSGRRIEIFFVDPATGAILDGTALVPDGAMQPHLSLDTTPFSSSLGPQQVAAGDVNADGVPDLVAAAQNGQDFVLLAVGTRAPDGVISYSLSRILPPAQGAGFGHAIELGDLDGDGRDEIVVSTRRGGKGNNIIPPKLHIYRVPAATAVLVQTVVPPQLQTASDVNYGFTLATGDLTGDGLDDVAASASEWASSGVPGSGAVFVHVAVGGATPLQATPLVIESPAPQVDDQFGGRVAIADVTGDASSQHDLLALDYWTGLETTGDVYAGPLLAAGQPPIAALRLTTRPGYTTGWGTRPASIGDLNADGRADVVVGTPNAPNGVCDSIGMVYVYLASGDPGTGGWTRYTFQPPTLDPDFGGFGWSTATVAESPFIFVGENGRNVGSVSGAGQVYIYRVLP
jgi:hypothetical protein